MPTSLVSTGVQFPDNSVQTTAATAVVQPTISGNQEAIATLDSTYTITDFDSFTTYTLSTTNGTVTRVDATITYTPSTDGSGGFVINGRTIAITVLAPATGQQAYTAAGTFTWVAPAAVGRVSVVAVGAGATGSSTQSGGGGGLGYKNNITVTSGNTYTVVVGATGAPGGDSYFISTSTVRGIGGIRGSAGGGFVGDGGGNGGAGVADSGGYTGGGGAGGYAGNGGAGTAGIGNTAFNSGSGGGAAGNSGASYSGGGGVGLLGQGSSGTTRGAGGSGGTNFSSTNGGLYGGGGGYLGTGGVGAVRIIWGINRSFPSTNTGNL